MGIRHADWPRPHSRCAGVGGAVAIAVFGSIPANVTDFLIGMQTSLVIAAALVLTTALDQSPRPDGPTCDELSRFNTTGELVGLDEASHRTTGLRGMTGCRHAHRIELTFEGVSARVR